MAEYFEALEADFKAHYGIDLREALWGPNAVGSRYLLSLVKGLPAESALGRRLLLNGELVAQTPAEPKPTPATASEINDFFSRTGRVNTKASQSQEAD